MMSRDLQGR